MAIIEPVITAAELRKLLKEYESLTAQSRQSGNTNLTVKLLLESVKQQLEPFAAAGFSDASAAISDIDLYVTLITQKSEEQSAALMQPQPSQTASQTAQDDAPQGPTKTPPQRISQPDTTGAGNTDTNTDPPVKTTEQTQATNGYDTTGTAIGLNIRSEDGTLSNLRRNPETGELYDAGGLPGGTELKTKAGTTTNDDAANTSTTTKQAGVNAANNTTIKVTAQPNILDDFYSYTYSASIYLLKPEQYTRLLNSKTKKIDGYNLLFQSGGASTNVGGPRPPPSAGGATETDFGAFGEAPVTPGSQPDGGRSPYFPNDFYIDSITIENQVMGKGTGAAHMASSIKFTVVEPQGITLLDRLYEAVANNEPKDGAGKVNYTAALYLMVIRFYGYDQDGNIQLPIKGGLQTDSNSSDPKAAVEKFIPFQLTKVNWTIGSKTVSYDFEGAPVGQIQGGYTSRGTIPYDVQLSDVTVGGLLGADAKYVPETAPESKPGQSTTANKPAAETTNKTSGTASAPQAPANASAAQPAKVVTQGLMGAMNQFQQDLVKRGVYTIADEYSIDFVGVEGIASGKDISGAKLQTANTKRDLSKAPGEKPATTSGGTKNLSPEKTQVDNVSRTFSITAGQQIVQAIELAIRNSEYISKQSLVTMNPDGTQEVNNTKTDPVKWFNITMSATQQPGGMDPKRNDYAYKIKYTVMPYALKNLDSQYFPYSKFSGVHKSYPYWFTGKNTAVRDYQETLNTMFTATISGSAPNNSLNAIANSKSTSSMYDIVRYNYSPRSNQSSQGADGKTYEPNANAAELIYNASDLAEAKVKIIGDPAWIQQGSMFRPVSEGTISANTAKTGFEPDGTISFDTQDVLFEMVWQRPEDYDLGTGLADPYARTAANSGGKRQPLQSRVYQAIKVVSEFKNGAFEQTLQGSIFRFPIPGNSNTANPAAADANPDKARNPNQTAATSSRTGLNLSAEAARDARSAFAAKDPRLISNATSVTGTSPTSATAQGQQQLLNPPKVYGDPNLTQLQNSQAYISARRGGATPDAALSAARESFAAGAGGSPVTSNGEAVGSGSSDAPKRLPNNQASNAYLDQQEAAAAQQIANNRERRLAARERSANASAVVDSELSNNPTSPTNAGNQKIVTES